jgi:hypothetical protein
MRLLVAAGNGVVRAGTQRASESVGAHSATRVERRRAHVVLFAAWES